jgi:hypothetical protein
MQCKKALTDKICREQMIAYLPLDGLPIPMLVMSLTCDVNTPCYCEVLQFMMLFAIVTCSLFITQQMANAVQKRLVRFAENK